MNRYRMIIKLQWCWRNEPWTCLGLSNWQSEWGSTLQSITKGLLFLSLHPLRGVLNSIFTSYPQIYLTLSPLCKMKVLTLPSQDWGSSDKGMDNTCERTLHDAKPSTGDIITKCLLLIKPFTKQSPLDAIHSHQLRPVVCQALCQMLGT